MHYCSDDFFRREKMIPLFFVRAGYNDEISLQQERAVGENRGIIRGQNTKPNEGWMRTRRERELQTTGRLL